MSLLDSSFGRMEAPIQDKNLGSLLNLREASSSWACRDYKYAYCCDCCYTLHRITSTLSMVSSKPSILVITDCSIVSMNFYDLAGPPARMMLLARLFLSSGFSTAHMLRHIISSKSIGSLSTSCWLICSPSAWSFVCVPIDCSISYIKSSGSKKVSWFAMTGSSSSGPSIALLDFLTALSNGV